MTRTRKSDLIIAGVISLVIALFFVWAMLQPECLTNRCEMREAMEASERLAGY